MIKQEYVFQKIMVMACKRLLDLLLEKEKTQIIVNYNYDKCNED